MSQQTSSKPILIGIEFTGQVEGPQFGAAADKPVWGISFLLIAHKYQTKRSFPHKKDRNIVEWCPWTGLGNQHFYWLLTNMRMPQDQFKRLNKKDTNGAYEPVWWRISITISIELSVIKMGGWKGKTRIAQCKMWSSWTLGGEINDDHATSEDWIIKSKRDMAM